MTGRSPNPGPPFVYRIYAASGELLYAGFSESMESRWDHHRRHPEYGHLVAAFTTEPVADRAAGIAREHEVIRTEMPRFNILDHPEPVSTGALLDPDDQRHGTRSSYVHYRCRCVSCRAANAEWQRQARIDRLTLPTDDPRHGTMNGYTNHGCRCDPCRATNTAWHQQRRARLSSAA